MDALPFYQSPDVTLEAFLAQLVPAAQKKCVHPQCGDSATSHMISYLKNTGSISFTVTILPEGKELPGGDNGDIWFWARPEGVSTALSINSTCHLQPATEHSCLIELLQHLVQTPNSTGTFALLCLMIPLSLICLANRTTLLHFILLELMQTGRFPLILMAFETSHGACCCNGLLIRGRKERGFLG